MEHIGIVLCLATFLILSIFNSLFLYYKQKKDILFIIRSQEDIVRQKKVALEQLTLKNQELMRLSSSRLNIMSLVASSLDGQLGTLFSIVDLVKDKMDVKARERFFALQNASHSLVSDAKFFTLLQQSKREPRADDFDLRMVLDRLFARLQQTLDRRGIKLMVQWSGSRARYLSGNKEALQHIFRNILLGIATVCSDKARIAVRLSLLNTAGSYRLSCEIQERSDPLYLKPFTINLPGLFTYHNVSEQVIGNPRQALFYFSHHITHECVKLLNGVIIARTGESRNMLYDFFVTLAAATTRSPYAEKTRVLVVDDSTSILSVVKLIFEKHQNDFIPLFSERMDVAIEKLTGNQIDWLITDYQLGEDSGLDLITRVRKLSPLTRFIMMTGVDSGEFRQLATGYGVEHFIEKSLDLEAFTKLLDVLKEQDPS